MAAFEPHVAPPTSVSGQPSILREAVVQTVNTDGTVDLKAVDSRSGWTRVAVPGWYTPTAGDHVHIAYVQGDPQQAVIISPIGGVVGTPPTPPSPTVHLSNIGTAQAPVAGAGFTVANAAVLATPDRISGLVVPTGGAIVQVYISARFSLTSAVAGGSVTCGGVALFAGGNQLQNLPTTAASNPLQISIGNGSLGIGASGVGGITNLIGSVQAVAGTLAALPSSGVPMFIAAATNVWLDAGTYTIELRHWCNSTNASALTVQDRKFSVVLPA